jgi:hypothetical protein
MKRNECGWGLARRCGLGSAIPCGGPLRQLPERPAGKLLGEKPNTTRKTRTLFETLEVSSARSSSDPLSRKQCHRRGACARAAREDHAALRRRAPLPIIGGSRRDFRCSAAGRLGLQSMCQNHARLGSFASGCDCVRRLLLPGCLLTGDKGVLRNNDCRVFASCR